MLIVALILLAKMSDWDAGEWTLFASGVIVPTIVALASWRKSTLAQTTADTTQANTQTLASISLANAKAINATPIGPTVAERHLEDARAIRNHPSEVVRAPMGSTDPVFSGNPITPSPEAIDRAMNGGNH